MKLNVYQALTPLLLSLLAACAKDSVNVTVTNDTGEQLGPRVVEIPAADVLSRLGSRAFYVTDRNGVEIPSQLTHDSLILFKAEVAPGESIDYTIHRSDSLHIYPATVWGQVYPKRRDDVSYENEVVGFRIYGPGTQAADEKAYGYDIFFKYPTEELIVPQLYAPETDDTVWAKVDSLRKISDQQAEDFIKSFSYHIDHGKGMDCYAVGSTLGDGVAALLVNDSICYPWCYDKVEILDNGPLRFTIKMKFAVNSIGDNLNVTEWRIISLDSGSHLNRCTVWYEGLDKDARIVTGFPLRDDTQPFADAAAGIVAYSDPTQGDTNGRALLGAVTDQPADSSMVMDNHILLVSQLPAGKKFQYNWGFAWDKTDIKTMADWEAYLKRYKLKLDVRW